MNIKKRCCLIMKKLGFKNWAIYKKIAFLNIVFITVTFIAMYGIVFQDYVNDKKKNEIKQIEIVNSQAAASINNYMTDLKTLTSQPLYETDITGHYTPLYGADILSILRESNNGRVISDSDRSYNSVTETQHITNDKTLPFTAVEQNKMSIIINRIMAFKKEIHSTFIFNLKGYNVYRMRDNELQALYKPSDEEWFREC